MVSHARKVIKFGLPCPEVEAIVSNSGLLSLCNIGYEMIDKGLLSAFVERWQRNTNTFHLPFGEMTIMLDDVLCILHIPVVGQFPTYATLEFGEVADILFELLGVEFGIGKTEMKRCRATHVRLSWLRDIYEQCCEAHTWGLLLGLTYCI